MQILLDKVEKTFMGALKPRNHESSCYETVYYIKLGEEVQYVAHRFIQKQGLGTRLHFIYILIMVK